MTHKGQANNINQSQIEISDLLWEKGILVSIERFENWGHIDTQFSQNKRGLLLLLTCGKLVLL